MNNLLTQRVDISHSLFYNKSMGKRKKEYKKNENITSLAIDTHLHLTGMEESERIIKDLKADGLKKIVVVVDDVESLKKVQKMREENENIFYIAGVHPYYLDFLTEEFVELINETKKTDSHLVGIGEIGLDYRYVSTEDEKQEQREKFVYQLRMANELKLPVSIHIREVYGEAIEILKANKSYITNGGIIHCCMANADEVKELVGLGFCISFSGTVTFVDQEESIRVTPIEKLLIETDSPYLTPAPYRGQKNEPKFVLVTAEKIANVLDKDVNEIINITTKNAENLLNI